MNRLLLLVMLVCSMGLSACNTIAGMGQDTKETGAFISGTPAHEAYNQPARNF